MVPGLTVDEVRMKVARSNDQPRALRDRGFVPPMNLDQFIRAARLPGRALHVAMCINFEVAVHGSKTIELSNHILTECGVDSDAKRRALAELEKAGLIKVERHRYASPMITWLAKRPRPKAIRTGDMNSES